MKIVTFDSAIRDCLRDKLGESSTISKYNDDGKHATMKD